MPEAELNGESWQSMTVDKAADDADISSLPFRQIKYLHILLSLVLFINSVFNIHAIL